MTWPQVEALISLSMKLQKRRRKQYRAEVWMFSLTGMFSRLKVGPSFESSRVLLFFLDLLVLYECVFTAWPWLFAGSSPLILRRVTPPNDVLLYNFLTVNVSQERNSNLSNLIIYPTSSSSAKTLPSSSSTKSSNATQSIGTLSSEVFTEISTSRPDNIPSNIDQAELISPGPDISLRFGDKEHSDEESGSGDLVSGHLEPSVKSGEQLTLENDQQGSSEANLSSSISTTIVSTSTTSTSTTTTTTTTTRAPATTTTTTASTTKPVSIEELRILQNEMINGLSFEYIFSMF